MKNQRFLASYVFMTSAFALMLFCSSCLKNRDNTPSPQAAGLMAFNLSPDMPLVGISLSGNIINAPLPYSGYTGGYVAVYPGNRITTSFGWNNKTAIASDSFNYQVGKYYSLFITGLNGHYHNVIVNDGLDSLRTSGSKSYVRYINAVPDSGGATMIFTDGQNNTITNPEVAFDSVSSFMPVDTGNLNISLNTGNEMVSREIPMKEGNAYTILLMGNPTHAVGNPGGNSTMDSLQIRYIINGKVMQDSTSQNLEKITE